jgi:hypothetical protein
MLLIIVVVCSCSEVQGPLMQSQAYLSVDCKVTCK